jgi:hypothetical protein
MGQKYTKKVLMPETVICNAPDQSSMQLYRKNIVLFTMIVKNV